MAQACVDCGCCATNRFLSAVELGRDRARSQAHRLMARAHARRVACTPGGRRSGSANMLRKFESNRDIRKLAEHVNANILNAPGSTPQGFLPYSIRLLGFRDRLRLLASLDLFQTDRQRPRCHRAATWAPGSLLHYSSLAPSFRPLAALGTAHDFRLRAAKWPRRLTAQNGPALTQAAKPLMLNSSGSFFGFPQGRASGFAGSRLLSRQMF